MLIEVVPSVMNLSPKIGEGGAGLMRNKGSDF